MKFLLFIIFLLVTSSLLPFRAFAQTVTPSSMAELDTASYELPYPGVLPDSPLYGLKALRDKIIGFLISDPLTKADFDLLQADKRLSASIYLQKFSPQKQALIVSTVSKAENYFDESLGQIDLAKKQGIDTTEELGKLARSSKKHDDVIEQLMPFLSVSYRTQMMAQAKRVTEFENKVNMELLKK